MESKNTTLENYYDLDEIAELLGLSYKAAQSRLIRAGITRAATRRQRNKKSRSLYKKSDVIKIIADNRLTNKKISLEPAEVYYIYESKINSL